MAALQRTVGQAGQEPVHRDAGLGLYTFLQPGVEHGGHPVEDHAPDAAVRPEGFQAVDHGGQGESAPPAVHHQHRRGAGGFGQMVGAGLMAHGDAVVVAHDSLDEGQAGPHAVVLQQGPGAVLPQEEQIQVAALGPDDLAVEHGVDVVGAAFKGHRIYLSIHQGLQKGAGHRGFAPSAGGGA